MKIEATVAVRSKTSEAHQMDSMTEKTPSTGKGNDHADYINVTWFYAFVFMVVVPVAFFNAAFILFPCKAAFSFVRSMRLLTNRFS